MTRQQAGMATRSSVVTTPQVTRTSRATLAATSTPREKGSGSKQDLPAKKAWKDRGSKKRKRGTTPESSSDFSVISMSSGEQTKGRRHRSRRRSDSDSEDSGDSDSPGERRKKKTSPKTKKGSKSAKSK